MPDIYEVEFNGELYEVEANSPEEAASAFGPQRQATPPPPNATIGMMQPSTMQGDPKRTEPYLAEEWAGMSGGEKLKNVAQWGAKAVMGAFAGPTGVDAAEHPKTTLATAALPLAAQKVPGVIAKVAGVSKQRGGANMDAALAGGKGLRVPMTPNAQDAALRARELAGSRNSEINNLFDRLTNPKVVKYRGDDLVTREAQDFITKFGNMSFDDQAKLPPVVRKELTTLTNELRSALTETLETVGKGDQYTRGVNEFRRAKRIEELMEKAAPYMKQLGYWVTGGSVAGAASRLGQP